jgi:cytoskeletal protein RodZ
MQEKSSLPLEAWASTLSDARRARGLDVTQTARELLLSPAQVRCIESASLDAFHGEGYYLRAVEKYAKFFKVELTPALQAMEQTDSQIALKRFNKAATVVTLAKREMNLGAALEVPTGNSNRTRLGLWLSVTLGAVVAVGAYLAIDEGWPNKKSNPASVVAIEQDSRPQTAQALTTTAPTPKGEQTSRQQMAVTVEPVRAESTAALASAPKVAPVATTGARDVTQGPSSAPTEKRADGAIPLTIASGPADPPTAPVLSNQAPAPQPVPDLIVATFTQDCWVEIRFNDDRVEQKIYKPGEKLELRAADVKGLVFGNAAAVNAQRANVAWSVMSFTLPGGNVARIPQASLQKP